ncbi:MAG TPA: hypothetical protein VE196_00155, partial [Pseudonocardiaceae bacterium]|nr:hypothetical protein [Pseudonocardiaceae bacterium]
KQGNLANYAKHMRPGSSIDKVLQGVGYPTPVTPVDLIPNDNFTKLKDLRAQSGAGRSNSPLGWVRST